MKKFLQRICSLVMPAMVIANMIGSGVLAEETTELTPYKKHTVPGIIVAADFDLGGEGIGYGPLTGLLQSDYVYRDDARLNFYTNAAGIVMGFNPGEWLKYTIEVKESGLYDINALYAAPGGTDIELTIDEKKLSGSLQSTEDWTNIEEDNIGNIALDKGLHVLTVSLVSGGCTLRGIRFEKTDMSQINVDFSRKTGPYRNIYIPTIIQAEDFDMTGNSDSKSKKSVYRAYEGIEIKANDTDGYSIVLSKGEETKYTFTAEQSGAYDISVCGKGSAKLYFDNYENSLEIKCDGKETYIVTVWIDKGVHQIKFLSQASTALDYIQVISSDKEYVTIDNFGATDAGSRVYKDFYVSVNGNDKNNGDKENPFKTIDKAREAAGGISSSMDGDIVIHIMSGTYYIDKKLVFSEKDSGQNGHNIIYMGENAIDKPVINGGTQISGWEKVNDYLWKASAPVEDTRTLYINGCPAQRARSKYIYYAQDYCSKENSRYGEDGVVVSAKNFLRNFEKSGDMELVWDLYWTSQRTPVESIEYDNDKVNIYLDQPYFRYARTKSWEGTNPSVGKTFYIENALELLDEPGEFYFDKQEKTVYYYPFEKENPETAETYVGTAEMMVQLAGSGIDDKIHNVIFDNIDFRYGAWNDVSTTGLAGVQADKIADGEYGTVNYGGRLIPSQFTVEYASGISVRNCDFTDLGSGAISMANAVSDSQIIGNKFCDISGSAVIIGHWDHTNNMPKGMERCVNIEVANNVIRRAASEFRGCCGISLYYVNSVNVHNNDIKDVQYTGITIGWGWGEDVYDCANNTIAYNRIENVTAPTHDGAHIYTLGPIRNSEIKGNYCIKAGDYRGGIYLDEGTGYIKVTENVIKESDVWLFARPGVGLKEIYAADNFSDTAELSQDEKNVTVERTTVITDGGWPQQAVEIMENAGVDDNYKRLLSNTDIPAWRTDFIESTPQTLFGNALGDQVEAEDFLKGGEGIGYHKLSGDIQIYANGFDKLNNYVIGDTKPGEWIKYKINTEYDAEYSLQVKAANNFAASEPKPMVNVYIDDVMITDGAEIPNNGSWEQHVWTELGRVELLKGEHIVKFEFNNNGFSFDAWKLSDESVEISYENDADYDEGIFVKESDINKKLFDDIDGHWAEEYITEMAQKGIINGIGGNLYAPDNELTLYQMIWLTMRSAGIDTSDESWKTQALKWGLLETVDEIDAPVLRERTAKIIVNAYRGIKGKYSLIWDTSAYTDFADISENYENHVLAAKTLGLMNGNNEGAFLPKNGLTRAEAAVVIKRLADII